MPENNRTEISSLGEFGLIEHLTKKYRDTKRFDYCECR